MDQTKFNEMFLTAMAEYRNKLRDNDSGTWSREAREWAVSVGLFAGNGTTDNGDPNMMWEDFLTREQAAQLFYRYASSTVSCDGRREAPGRRQEPEEAGYVSVLKVDDRRHPSAAVDRDARRFLIGFLLCL